MTYVSTEPKQSYQYHMSVSKKSILSRFFQWAAEQEKDNHIGWVGATVTSMTAVFFPLTMGIILFTGSGFGLIIAAMVSLVLVVVTNLAAMPTKYTIPAYFIGILIDIVAIVIALSFM